MIRMLTLSYEASAAILPFRIVAASDAANSSKVATAATATAALVGTTGKVGQSVIGQMVDVEVAGVPQVQLGGTVAFRDPLTSDAQGRAIKATVNGQKIIGYADEPGVVDEIIDYLSAPGVLSGV